MRCLQCTFDGDGVRSLNISPQSFGASVQFIGPQVHPWMLTRALPLVQLRTSATRVNGRRQNLLNLLKMPIPRQPKVYDQSRSKIGPAVLLLPLLLRKILSSRLTGAPILITTFWVAKFLHRLQSQAAKNALDSFSGDPRYSNQPLVLPPLRLDHRPHRALGPLAAQILNRGEVKRLCAFFALLKATTTKVEGSQLHVAPLAGVRVIESCTR